MLTQSFPREELYGLTSQLRRAIVSVPSNLAEGHSRSGTKDYIQYVSVAIGSLAEAQTHILLAEDLNYTESSQTESLHTEIIRIQKMLHSLRNSLKAKLQSPQSPMPKAQSHE